MLLCIWTQVWGFLLCSECKKGCTTMVELATAACSKFLKSLLVRHVDRAKRSRTHIRVWEAQSWANVTRWFCSTIHRGCVLGRVIKTPVGHIWKSERHKTSVTRNGRYTIISRGPCKVHTTDVKVIIILLEARTGRRRNGKNHKSTTSPGQGANDTSYEQRNAKTMAGMHIRLISSRPEIASETRIVRQGMNNVPT